MSDTPRTDAVVDHLQPFIADEVTGTLENLARELELELAARGSHVAWLRYNDHNGARATTVHLCDSDAPGAFKVYRVPPDCLSGDLATALRGDLRRLREALEEIVNASDLKNWALREIAERALNPLPAKGNGQ